MLRSAAAALLLAAALPAAGPPGTVATLSGAGLPARSHVVVTTGRRIVARRTTDARGAFTTTLTLRGATDVPTRVGPRTRVRNRFRGGSTPAGEAVTPEGARLRWTPVQALAGTPVHLSGA